MSLVSLRLQSGSSIFEQLVTASIKAIVSGEFKEGQPFPSVRTLAADFKIHPNTAQKVIQHLLRERFLEGRPGIGTAVAKLPANAADSTDLLRAEADRFVEEALRMGVGLPEAVRMIRESWSELAPENVGAIHDRRK